MTTYAVTLDLKTVGSLDFGLNKSGGLSSATTSVATLRGALHDLRDVGGKFMGVLDGIAGRVGALAAVGGGALLSAGFYAAYEGVTKLNAELEATTISLGTIFKANGQTNDLASGFEMAGEQLAKMRKDARDLPGELEDLKRIFVTAAIPGFGAGADADRIRKLSASTMAFAAVAQVPQAVAARELAMLLEGRAGAHNVLGQRLDALSGDKAKSFNAMGADKRLEYIEGRLAAYSGSIDRFKNSYEGLSSAFVDNVKQFGLAATTPLFDRVKTTLAEINNWFDSNPALVASWADYIGSNAGAAFDSVKAKFLEWWPILKEFATNMKAELGHLSEEFGPILKAFETWAKAKMADKNTPGQIENLVKDYAALKVIAGIGSTVVNGALAVNAGLNVAKFLGYGGLGAGGAAAGSGGAASGLGLGAAGGGLGLGLGLGGAAAGLAGALFYGAFGGIDSQVETDAKNKARGEALAAESLKKYEAMVEWGQISHKEMVERVVDDATFMREHFQTAAADALELALAMKDAAFAAGLLSAKLDNPNRQGMQADGMTGDPSGWAVKMAKEPNRDYSYWGQPIVDSMSGLTKEVAKPPKHKGGKGGTTIQRVEIVVTQNNNPSRVARSVVDELSKLSRNPRVSRFAPSTAR